MDLNKDNTNFLNKKLAQLETKVDLLEAELCYVDAMLKRCGFPEGVQTLKETMVELLTEEAFFEEADPVYKKNKEKKA